MKLNVGNAQHIGKRSEQQDAFGFSDPKDKAFLKHGGFLGLVADGMGGTANGRAAGRAAVRAFLEAYRAKTPDEPIVTALERSLQEANRAVLAVGRDLPSETGTGTTLAAAVIHENSVYWISAGDSRVYLFRQNSLTQITLDHTYAQELDKEAAEGRISREEALNHPQRGSLISFLGMPGKLEADRSIRPLAIEPGDCVILCSDGIYRAVSEKEICDSIGGDLNEACETLMQHALRKNRSQQDNLTVIAFSGNGKGLPGFARRHPGLRRGLWIAAFAVALSAGVFGGRALWVRLYATLRPNTSSGVSEGSPTLKAPAGVESPDSGLPVQNSGAGKGDGQSRTANTLSSRRDAKASAPDAAEVAPALPKATDAKSSGALESKGPDDSGNSAEGRVPK